jgi:hypothetical protein
MPTPEILKKLKEFLANSRAFATLLESEQLNYLSQIEQADDEQLVYIMQMLEEEDKKLFKAEQLQLTQASQQVEMAEKISKELRESKKIVQQAKEDEDQTQSAALLNQMEEQLKPDHAVADKKEAPRKKFLGLF